MPPSNRRFQDEAGNRIVPGEKLGEGGEGAVYLVEGDPGSVVKIWHPGRTPQDADAKLRHLLRNPVEPDLGATWQITWPQHLVQENGVTVGYTMPLLDPSASWEPIVEYYNRRAAQATEQEQGRELRVDDRVRMATNLALGFRAVHAAGYVIGDVNEKNVEVNRQNDIAMVDCDSYGFTDPAAGRTFANNMGRPEFQAPEAQDDYTNRSQNHDRFGLAVIIFHLLTGFHPYTVVNQPDHPQPGDRINAWLFPPSNRMMVEAPAPYDKAWDALTEGQKELFERCFDWQYQGQPRPTPGEWLEALQEMPSDVAPTSQPPLINRPVAPQPPSAGYRSPPRPPTPPAYRPRPPTPAPQATPAPAATPPRRGIRWRTVLIGAAALFIAYVSCSLVVMAFEEWRDFRKQREYARLYQAATASGAAGSAPIIAATSSPGPTGEPTRPPSPTLPVVANVSAGTAAPPTAVPAPTSSPTPAATGTPAPAPTQTPTPVLAATARPTPTAALPPPPAPTLTPVEWLYPNATHSIVSETVRGEEVRLQGCYLGKPTSARRFRLASWNAWDPGLYGNRLKFIKIITNNGAQIPLEPGLCYEAKVVKHVDSPEEYVCLDKDTDYPERYPCDNFREHEVIPTFLLYPDNPDDPETFTKNLVSIRARP